MLTMQYRKLDIGICFAGSELQVQALEIASFNKSSIFLTVLYLHNILAMSDFSLTAIAQNSKL